MRGWRAAVAFSAALGLAASPAAADEPSVLSSTREELAARRQEYWKQVKAAMKRGECREALPLLEAIQRLDPQDRWAPLYHSLCKSRLNKPSDMPRMDAEELKRLEQRLEQEESKSRRSASQQRAMERRIRQEQQRWEEGLKGPPQPPPAAGPSPEQKPGASKRDMDRAPPTPAAKRSARRDAEVEQLEREQVQEHAMASEAHDEGDAGEDISSADAPDTDRILPSQTSAEDEVELQRVVVSGSQVSTHRPAHDPASEHVTINASQMQVLTDRKKTVAQGDVEVLYHDVRLTCDRLTMFTDTHDVYAEGHVRFEQGRQTIRAELAHYNFDTKKGRFLQGTVSNPPWHEHGRSLEHLAEGVYLVTPGYITSCDLEPPHFRFYGRRTTVFTEDRLANARNVALLVEDLPLFYLPRMVLADRQSPFFLIPGKNKRWGQFGLGGYRYEGSAWPAGVTHEGTVKVDWRRNFGWGTGVDHLLESPELGKGLLRFYYNDLKNRLEPNASLPKGAIDKRYRLMWRHLWKPREDTTVVTNIQKYSDINFRSDLLFRDEHTQDAEPASFVSLAKSGPAFTVTGLMEKRVNRFQSTTESLPQLAVDVPSREIGDTRFYSQSKVDFASVQTRTAHSDLDEDVVKLDWFQQFNYGLGLFQPIEVTPLAGVRQTYYTKDKQGATRQGKRDVVSGQASAGVDASLKLFRIIPVTPKWFGLDLQRMRHVLTPSVSHRYTHEPTVPNELLNFGAAGGPGNTVTFAVDNALQGKRLDNSGGLYRMELVRGLMSIPYTFQGSGNKQGGRLGDWAFDVELYPWPWIRVETDWSYPSHFIKHSRDSRITKWNLDVVMVGGTSDADAEHAAPISAPSPQGFVPGPKGGIELLPLDQWYLGLGHRYSYNDKTEDVLQFDWRLGPKWQIGTFHRFTWKEIVGGAKRLTTMREYQYSLRRDLHDWVGEVVYRVDREYGEEVFFTLTLKAYPGMPIEMADSYHQPKVGSQSSPFSPVVGQHPVATQSPVATQ